MEALIILLGSQDRLLKEKPLVFMADKPYQQHHENQS
jgi:hypothetical protein